MSRTAEEALTRKIELNKLYGMSAGSVASRQEVSGAIDAVMSYDKTAMVTKRDLMLSYDACMRLNFIHDHPGGVSGDSSMVCCDHCGRTWKISTPKREKSIVLGAKMHANVCYAAKPEERRAIARLDDQRWLTTPADYITLDPTHPGYDGVDYRSEYPDGIS